MTTEPCANAIERDPSYADDNLIWIDMEMTGLQPEVNRVLEVAAIITDKNLNILREGPVVAIHQPKAVLDGMDAWNTETHTKSGLVARCLESTVDEEKCAQIFTEVFRRYVPEGKSPMCGNTIGQDRRFMARWIPGMERYFHYRSIDVSRNSAAGGLRKKFGSELVSTSIKPLRILRKVFMNFPGIGRKYFVSN